MIGERVAVLRCSRAGEDEMGDPFKTWSHEIVDGALERPVTGDDPSDQTRPDGVSFGYSIALPKSYTAACDTLEGARIALVDRGMDPEDEDAALIVDGRPDRTMPCPTKWDMVFRAWGQHG